MALTDHVAIILSASLDQPRAGKANPNKPDFYVQAAFEPSAGSFLLSAMNEASPTGKLNGLRYNVKTNGAQDKPFAGIPDDYLIVRLGTGPDFPPELFTQTGQQISALPVNRSQIASEFFAGQRVRVNGYPRYWTHDSGAKGVSWSLNGVMSVGGGERRPGAAAGEPNESAFAKYRDNVPVEAAAPAASAQAASTTTTPATGGNPFQQAGGGAFG